MTIQYFSIDAILSTFGHAMNDWVSATKRVENFDTYGLAIVDFHYPETTHLNLQGPDGIYYRFNHIEVED